MKILKSLLALIAIWAVFSVSQAQEVNSAISTSAASSRAINVLFVGNSFTFGALASANYYNARSITDANGTGYGGVPGIFKQLTLDTSLNYNVTMEASPGKTLGWHFVNKSNIIFQAKWNKVFLQGYSTEPLPKSRDGNFNNFNSAVGSLVRGILAANDNADVILYETWPRADLTYRAHVPYYRCPIETMANDLHNGYYSELNDYPNIHAVSPAGDAWLRAIEEGIALRDPYDGSVPGKVDLWESGYHASNYGYYLSALVLFGTATGVDPRTLGYEPAAMALGISSNNAIQLERVAFETLKNAPNKAEGSLASKNPRTGGVPAHD